MVPVPRDGDDAGSDAGVEEWKRCINMEAAWLINDLKPAVKVSLFAGAALEARVLNANSASEPGKGQCCPPGMELAQGEPSQPSASLISVHPGHLPLSGEPHSLWGSAEKPSCFLGKGQAPAGLPCGMLQRTGCFLGCLVRHLSTEFDLQRLITHINAVSSTHAKIERLDANARELI